VEGEMQKARIIGDIRFLKAQIVGGIRFFA
jgi:hypothetical protein